MPSNIFIKGVSHKIRRQIEDLERVGGVEHGTLTVDGVPVDSYLTRSPSLCLPLLPFFLAAPTSRGSDLRPQPGAVDHADRGGQHHQEAGFHQSRWGYHNLSVVEDVVENYRSVQIPLDMIWNDDDHMDARKDFTLSPVNYPRPKLVAFLNMLQLHCL
ncbi:hypothetical protein ZWY2020_058700 [Hordeum vulgare]|nr:hypothetical protein ZWY2020_058700 [Hordeum vulgare]